MDLNRIPHGLVVHSHGGSLVLKLCEEVEAEVMEVDNRRNALPLTFLSLGVLQSPKDCCFAQPLHTPR